MASTGLCLTPACIHAASELLYNLAPNYKEINACTNFEELVCDGYRRRHFLRPEQPAISSFGSVAETGESILRSILESPYPSESNHSHFSPRNLGALTVTLDEQNFNQIQRAYNHCMALPAIKAAGVAPLERELTDLAATFGNGSTWADTNLFLLKHSISGLYALYVSADDKAPDTQTIFISPRGSPGLPAKAYYQDKDIVSQYRDAVGQVLGALKPTAQDAKGRAAAVVDFETKIASITPDREDMQDPVAAYNPTKIRDFVKTAPQLGLDFVLKSLVPSNYTSDTIIVSNPAFFGNLSALLDKTPKETIQSYFSWRLTVSRLTSVEAPEVQPYLRFSRKLNGRDENAVPDRAKTCITYVDNNLGWILSRFFVEKAFSAASKDLGNKIISDVKSVYIERLARLDWMDDSVKVLAAKKVNNIVQKVGYPVASPNIMDPQDLQNHYKGLNVSDSFYDTILSSIYVSVARGWEQLGKPTDRADWSMTASTVNAYYSPSGNEIVFPAGIMQFPFFGGELPGYINYGGFGSVAGHELSHAFDPNGRRYDVDGKLSDWWTNRTSQEFDKRAQCFIDEYSNFTVSGTNGSRVHVKGKQTLGENVADAGGLQASYAAWQKERKTKTDQDLPGLSDFTHDQLFYLAYGNVWCAKYRPESLLQTIQTDSHSPDTFRIMGAAMLNSRGFREAFKCPQKEPVCEIW